MIAGIAALIIGALAITYLSGLAPEEATPSAKFSLLTVRGSTILVRNDGTAPIEPGTLKVLVNGIEFPYESELIEPNDIGELTLELVPGPCPVKVELLGAFRLMTADANLCVYNEEFDSPEAFQGIDILRTIRSFDPCMPCTVHMETGEHIIVRDATTCACGVE
jgi:hypothetical protein